MPVPKSSSRTIDISGQPPFNPAELKKLYTTIGIDGNLYTVLQKSHEKVWVKLHTGYSDVKSTIVRWGNYFEKNKITYESFNKMMKEVMLYEPSMLFGSYQYDTISSSFLFFAIMHYHQVDPKYVGFSYGSNPKALKVSPANYENLKLALINHKLEYIEDDYGEDIKEIKRTIPKTFDSISDAKEYFEDTMELMENGKFKLTDKSRQKDLKKEVNEFIKVCYYPTDSVDKYFNSNIISTLWEATTIITDNIFPKADITIPDCMIRNYFDKSDFQRGYEVFLLWSQGLIADLSCLQGFST